MLFARTPRLGESTHWLEHLCAMSVALGLISHSKLTPQTEFIPKI